MRVLRQVTCRGAEVRQAGGERDGVGQESVLQQAGRGVAGGAQEGGGRLHHLGGDASLVPHQTAQTHLLTIRNKTRSHTK